jgi:hypothetical protein
MLTSARIEADLKPAGLDWISCLRAPAIQQLAAANGPLQLSLFDERDLAAERARKREELLVATERHLALIQARATRGTRTLRTEAEIGLAVGAVLNKRKVGKHFVIDIGAGHFGFRRDAEKIAEEARLDGLYVIRTSVPAEQLDADQTVQAYKDLARVERAFWSLKTVDLGIRPIRHWTAQRVRAHVFLCMLAYHVGICVRRWRRSCSMTPISGPRGHNGLHRSLPPSPPMPPRRKRPASATPMDCRLCASPI